VIATMGYTNVNPIQPADIKQVSFWQIPSAYSQRRHDQLFDIERVIYGLMLIQS